MKNYKKTNAKTIQAYQFDGEENEDIKYITHDDYGNVMVSPVAPIRSAYYAIKINNDWKKVKIGDWIVLKGDKKLIIKNDIFQLLYDEI